jgi:hypothetical protein
MACWPCIRWRVRYEDQHDIETPITFGDALAATQTASHIYEEEILQEDEPAA